MKRAGLEVGEEGLAELASWLRVKRLAQALGMRARVVLLSGQGLSLREVARRLGVSERTVCLWRRRYRRGRLAGLRSRPRSGRPRRVSRRKELAVVAATMRPPQHATHWSARRLAKGIGLSFMSVHRVWEKYGLQPHRVETFKFSTDPEFAAKLADIVGLYLDPPERALVLCVDEKRCPFDSPCYGGSLRASSEPAEGWSGLPARRTHDYTRHGTTSRFAALEVASGKVHGRCFKHHTHVGFIAFLESLARRYTKPELHLICDNYGTHKHPKVRAWLAAHPRLHLHFTSTSASWLNPFDFAQGTAWSSAGSA